MGSMEILKSFSEISAFNVGLNIETVDMSLFSVYIRNLFQNLKKFSFNYAIQDLFLSRKLYL